MKKTQRIDVFFKRKNSEDSTSQVNPSTTIDPLNSESRPEKSQRIENNEKFNIQSFERDPGLRVPIWKWPIDKHDEVRRAYIKAGPYQCTLSNYPKSGGKHPRSFQASWFTLYPSWLEYSPTTDAVFCLPCYLFHTPNGPSGSDAFTETGFRSWKKVRDGTNCSFLAHIGKDLTSPHRNAEKACADLMNQQSHIAHHIEKFSSQEVVENRRRLMTSIEAIKYLAFQGCSFRGHDESKTSSNRGNFLELLRSYSVISDEVKKVLHKAPRNASYTSPTIQKQILQVLATKVKNAIREEIGEAKFCIIVDEARDESKKEQMSIVLRFVDKDGFVQERFFGVVHVKDTIASTLKEGIISVLSRHNLDVQNIRGQGYDQLKAAHASNIAYLLSIDEIESGRGLNQIGSLQRPGDTRWSSHLKSLSSLMTMFSATCEVLLDVNEHGNTPTNRAEAHGAYEVITSFEFVFLMHLMRKVLEISNILCQALQLQSQDILNAMHLVSSTKLILQKLRDSGWDELVANVKSFCEGVNIHVPDFDAQYTGRKGRVRYTITIGHHYKINLFNVVIDSQMQELNDRFDDKSMELIILSSSLDPKEMRLSFRIDDICKLVEKFYPQDFADYEILQLRIQFEHFDHVRELPEFRSLESLSDLCQWLVKTRKSNIYPLVYRVVALILTLPVSTATTERSFSAMKLVKSTLRNSMEDEFLTDILLVYMEREIAKQFSTDSIIDDFRDMQERRSKF